MQLVGDGRRLVRWAALSALVITGISVVFRLIALDPAVSTALAAGRPAAFPGFPLLLPVLDVDGEGNLPAWLSACVLLVSALLLWGFAVRSRAVQDVWWRHWAVLAFAFAYLSVDELSQLHELGVPLISRIAEVGGVLTFGWVLIAAPLVVLFAIAFLRFLLALPFAVGRLMVLGGVLYVGGALGFEMVGGWYFGHPAFGEASVPYVLASSVEEALEMAGALVFLHALTLVHRIRHPSAAGVSPAAVPGPVPV